MWLSRVRTARAASLVYNCGSSKVISHAVEKALHEHFAPIDTCPQDRLWRKRGAGYAQGIGPYHVYIRIMPLPLPLPRLRGGPLRIFPRPLHKAVWHVLLAIRPCSRGDASARAVF